MADENADLGTLKTVVELDTNTGFQEGIANISRQMRVLQSDFKASVASLTDFGKGLDGLKLKSDSLSKQIDVQKQKVDALSQAHDKAAQAQGEDSRAAETLQIKLNNANATLSNLENQLKNTNKQITIQSSSWTTLGKSFNDIGTKMNTIGSSMANVGKKLSTYVTLPLVALGTAATKSAMDAVESEELFTVSMGDQADAARAWSDQISKSLGLNEYEIRKNLGTFNVLLLSLGKTKDAALNMSEGLTKLSYDMASFYNISPEEAMDKLKSGITGEVKPLKDLGIVLDETQVEQYALSQGMIQAGQTMDDTTKVTARYGLIMKDTSQAQNDLARTINSPTNQLRIMKEEIAQLGIEFGQDLIPVLENFMETVKPIIEHLSNMSKGSQEVLVKFGLVVTATGPVLTIFGNLTKICGGVVTAFGAIATAIGKAGGILGMLSSLLTALQGPVGWAVVGIGLLTAGILYLVNRTKTVKPAADEAKQAFDDAYKSFEQNPSTEGLDSLQQKLDKLKDTSGYDEAIIKVKELKQEIADLEEKNKNPNLNGISKAANNSQIYNDQQAMAGYQKTIDNVTKSQNDFNNAKKQSQQEADKEAQSMGYENAAAQTLDETYKDLQQKYEDATSSVQELYQIQNELNSKDGISANTYQMMIEKHQELLPYLNNEGLLRQKISQLIAQESQTQKAAYQAMLENSTEYFNAQIKGNSTLWNEISKCYSTDYENFATISDLKNKVDASLISVIGQRWSSLYGSEAKALEGAISMTSREIIQVNKLYGSQGTEVANDLSNTLDTLKQERDILSGLSNIETPSLNNIDFGKVDLGNISSPSSSSSKSDKGTSGSGSSTSASDKQLQGLQDEMDKFNSDTLQPLNDAFSNLDANMQMLPTNDLAGKMKSLSDEESKEKDILIAYQNEYNKLSKETFPKDSAAYKQKQSDISQLNQSINDAKVKVNDLNNQFNSTKMDEWNQSFNNSLSGLQSYQQTAEATAKMLSSDDYAGQTKNLGDQIYIQTQLLDKYKKQLSDLSKQSFPENTDAATKLSDEIATLTKNIQDSNVSIYSLQNDLASTLINSQKQYDQAVLNQEEATMNANIKNYENSLFGGTEDQYEENITAQNDAIQQQIDALDEQNDELQEQQDLQQKLLDITDAQNKLNNVMNEKNVEELVKDANGNWQYQYVADAQKVEDAQKDLKDKQDDYAKTVYQNQINEQKKALQAEIDNNNKILNAKKQELQDYTTAQQNAYNADKAMFDQHYADMEVLTQATLTQLTTEFTDNWDNIVDAVKTRVDSINTAIASISKVDLSFLNLGSLNGGTGATAGNKIPHNASGTDDFPGGWTWGNENGMELFNLPRGTQIFSHPTTNDILNTIQLLPSIFNNVMCAIASSTANIKDTIKSNLIIDVPSIKSTIGSKLDLSVNPNSLNSLNNDALIKVLNNLSKSPHSQVFNISKLEFPNVHDADGIIDAIKTLPEYARIRLGGREGYGL